MKYEVIFTAEVQDPDWDLTKLILDVIKSRFEGSAVQILEISITEKEKKTG